MRIPILILISPLVLALTLAFALTPKPGDGSVRDGAFLGKFVAAKAAIAPGETIDIALWIRHDKGFHTYWKEPGIVGVQTEIEWAKSGGLKPGEIFWPQPQRVKMGPYDALGYEDEVFLVVPITAAPNAEPGTVAKLSGRASFMICPAVLSETETCYPGFVDLELEIPITAKPTGDTKWAKHIAAARATSAKPNTFWNAKAERSGGKVKLTLSPREGVKIVLPKRPYFFSSDGQVHSDIEQDIKHNAAGLITVSMTLSEFGPQDATHLNGILYTITGLPDGTGAKPIALAVPYSKR